MISKQHKVEENKPRFIYLLFRKVKNGRSKTRYDLIFYSSAYEPLTKANEAGICCIYLTDPPDHIFAHSKRKPAKSLSKYKKYLTGVYMPDPEKVRLAFGDLGSDALLFLLGDEEIEIEIEILVFLGKKNVVNLLFNMLADGKFDEEIQGFRNSSSFRKA